MLVKIVAIQFFFLLTGPSAGEISEDDFSKNTVQFHILEYAGSISYRSHTSLTWQPVKNALTLDEGDLVWVGKNSFLLLEISEGNKKDNKKTLNSAMPSSINQSRRRVYHDQEGILSLKSDLLREVKLIGSILRFDQQSSSSVQRERALRSFSQAYSKAKVINLNQTNNDQNPVMNLGRIDGTKSNNLPKQTIKIIHPNRSERVYFKELPKKIEIHWRQLGNQDDLKRQYAVFIWKEGKRPKEPVAVTDQTNYTYEVKEPGRFRVRILEVNLGYESFASSDFRLLHEWEGVSNTEDSMQKLPRDMEKFIEKGRLIYVRYPLRGFIQTGQKECKQVPFVLKELDIPRLKYILEVSEESQPEIVMRRKVFEEGVVEEDLPFGSYIWGVKAFDSKGVLVGKSFYRKFFCKNGNQFTQMFKKGKSEELDKTWSLAAPGTSL